MIVCAVVASPQEVATEGPEMMTIVIQETPEQNKLSSKIPMCD